MRIFFGQIVARQECEDECAQECSEFAHGVAKIHKSQLQSHLYGELIRELTFENFSSRGAPRVPTWV